MRYTNHTCAAAKNQDCFWFIPNTLAFQGRRWDRLDAEFGVYYRNRYYSPLLGRFMQRDPAGYQDGINLYAFGTGVGPFGLLHLARKARQ